MAIDRERIITALSELKLRGDENGLISGFGVLVQNLPATIWTLFSERFIRTVPNELMEAAEYLVADSAHECGYHTGHGIVTSEEWKAVVAPMIETTEDMLHGALAVFAAWGWGKAEVHELVPGERLVLRAYDYYEADVVEYGRSSKLSAYLMAGASAALMDLTYGGEYDPEGKAGLRTFSATQTKGIECGDDYGEFVVERT
jgi:hypothetical protein